MILDDLSPDAAEIDLIGWPWHGRVELAVGAPSTQSRIVMPSRTIVNGDPVSASPNDGTWTIEAGDSQAQNTFLWAPPGMADVADPEIEGQGGAWWGRAILRGLLLRAYGNFLPARAGDSEPVGASWPFWLGGKKGQAHLYAQPEGLFLRVIEDDAVSGADAASTAYVTAVAAIDLQQATPDYYVDGALVTTSTVDMSIVDMSPDGSSILLWVLSRNLANPIARSERTGLVRLDLVGTAGSYTGALSVVLSRAAFVGTLVETGPASLPSVGWHQAPLEVKQTTSPWPACGDRIEERQGAIGAYPPSGPTYAGRDGGGTREVGISGAVCNAWFGVGGNIEVIRYDATLTQTISNTRTDGSTGLFRYVETWTNNGANCELTGTTETNTIEYAISGLASNELVMKLRLYSSTGIAADEMTLRTVEQVSAQYNGTTGVLTGEQTRKRYVNGSLIAEQTLTDVPPAGWGLPPNSATAFGFQFGLPSPVLSSGYRIIGDTSTDSIGVFAQIGVMDGSNKASLLASLYRVSGGPNQIASDTVVTPAGAQPDPFSVAHTFSGPPNTLENIETQRMFMRAYNPVTGEIARAWPDLQTVSWV